MGLQDQGGTHLVNKGLITSSLFADSTLNQALLRYFRGKSLILTLYWNSREHLGQLYNEFPDMGFGFGKCVIHLLRLADDKHINSFLLAVILQKFQQFTGLNRTQSGGY